MMVQHCALLTAFLASSLSAASPSAQCVGAQQELVAQDEVHLLQQQQVVTQPQVLQQALFAFETQAKIKKVPAQDVEQVPGLTSLTNDEMKKAKSSAPELVVAPEKVPTEDTVLSSRKETVIKTQVDDLQAEKAQDSEQVQGATDHELKKVVHNDGKAKSSVPELVVAPEKVPTEDRVLSSKKETVIKTQVDDLQADQAHDSEQVQGATDHEMKTVAHNVGKAKSSAPELDVAPEKVPTEDRVLSSKKETVIKTQVDDLQADQAQDSKQVQGATDHEMKKVARNVGKAKSSEPELVVATEKVPTEDRVLSSKKETVIKTQVDDLQADDLQAQDSEQVQGSTDHEMKKVAHNVGKAKSSAPELVVVPEKEPTEDMMLSSTKQTVIQTHVDDSQADEAQDSEQVRGATDDDMQKVARNVVKAKSSVPELAGAPEKASTEDTALVLTQKAIEMATMKQMVGKLEADLLSEKKRADTLVMDTSSSIDEERRNLAAVSKYMDTFATQADERERSLNIKQSGVEAQLLKEQELLDDAESRATAAEDQESAAESKSVKLEANLSDAHLLETNATNNARRMQYQISRVNRTMKQLRAEAVSEKQDSEDTVAKIKLHEKNVEEKALLAVKHAEAEALNVTTWAQQEIKHAQSQANAKKLWAEKAVKRSDEKVAAVQSEAREIISHEQKELAAQVQVTHDSLEKAERLMQSWSLPDVNESASK